MTLMRQTTLQREVEVAGTAIHSGKFVQLGLKPAPADHGIVFCRVDGANGGVSDTQMIRADFRLVHDTTLGTNLRNESGLEVCTVEHLMAALAGCGVDNALVVVDGPEIPILDGSSEEFVRLIDRAGIKSLEVDRRYIKIVEPISVNGKDKSLTLEPYDGFSVEMSIDFDAAAVGKQDHQIQLVNGAFREEISSARTFGFSHEVEKLRSLGLALGGSLENTIVVEDDRILNSDGLRFNNEFVRHKILDAIGDLYLAGAPILGRLIGVCSGHTLNNQLLRALFDTPDCWIWETRRAGLDEHLHGLGSAVKEAAIA